MIKFFFILKIFQIIFVFSSKQNTENRMSKIMHVLIHTHLVRQKPLMQHVQRKVSLIVLFLRRQNVNMLSSLASSLLNAAPKKPPAKHISSILSMQRSCNRDFTFIEHLCLNASARQRENMTDGQAEREGGGSRNTRLNCALLKVK